MLNFNTGVYPMPYFDEILGPIVFNGPTVITNLDGRTPVYFSVQGYSTNPREGCVLAPGQTLTIPFLVQDPDDPATQHNQQQLYFMSPGADLATPQTRIQITGYY